MLRPLGPQGGDQTSHFSVLDREGNAVSVTQSINFSFGSGFVPPGTGVVLNNEMDDFSIKPGFPNGYGLIGGEANAIEPGKRMLSSMTPTLLDSPDGLALLGTPGGSRIITMVLLASLAWIEGADAAGPADRRNDVAAMGKGKDGRLEIEHLHHVGQHACLPFNAMVLPDIGATNFSHLGIFRLIV